jgi:acetolactate synthase-1/2/3 large subunit
MMIINNQHLGMVVQWEDRFYKANRAHTFLGVDNEYHVTGDEVDIFPDFVTVAQGFRVPGRRVTRRSDLRAAIQEMIDTPGPFLLDVMVRIPSHRLPLWLSSNRFSALTDTVPRSPILGRGASGRNREN